MCGIASLFLLQRLKGSMLGDAQNFSNMEMRTVIKFFFLQGKAEGNSRHSDRNIHHRIPPSKTGWPSLDVVIFPPVMHLVLDDSKQ